MKANSIKGATDKTFILECSKIKEELQFVLHENKTVKFISRSLLSSLIKRYDIEIVEVNIDEYVRIFEGEFALSEIYDYIEYRTNLKRFEGYVLKIKME